jgi:hypothetical protein
MSIRGTPGLVVPGPVAPGVGMGAGAGKGPATGRAMVAGPVVAPKPPRAGVTRGFG